MHIRELMLVVCIVYLSACDPPDKVQSNRGVSIIEAQRLQGWGVFPVRTEWYKSFNGCLALLGYLCAFLELIYRRILC